MFLLKIFQIPQMFSLKIHQIPQMFCGLLDFFVINHTFGEYGPRKSNRYLAFLLA